MAGEDATATDYDDPMSDRLLGIAADVLRSFGSAFGGRHLAIIGGTAPSLLVAQVPSGIRDHVGTADLDLHLSLHLLDGETADYYHSIIEGLRKLGLSPAKEHDRQIRWRWIGRHRNVRLQVEFLCPARSRGGRPEAPALDTPAESNIGPNGQITALALGFGHLVEDDTIFVERQVDTKDGLLRYEFPVAGITSWLCLKADAIRRRSKLKDAYDVVWVLSALGPNEAAILAASSPLFDGPHRTEVIEQLERLVFQFSTTNHVGPNSYALFVRSDAPAIDKRDAVACVTSFGQALRGLLEGSQLG